MQSQTRDHAAALAGILSAISFGFKTVLGTLPVGALPRAPAGIIDTISSVNAIINASPEVFVE